MTVLGNKEGKAGKHGPGFNPTFTMVTIAVVTSRMLRCLPERGTPRITGAPVGPSPAPAFRSLGVTLSGEPSLCAGGTPRGCELPAANRRLRKQAEDAPAPRGSRGGCQALSSSTLSDGGPACELAFQTSCREGWDQTRGSLLRRRTRPISLQGQPPALPAATRGARTRQAHDL